MSNNVIGTLDSEAANRRARAVKLRTREVRRGGGKAEKVFVLDASSPDFDDAFLRVFQLNAARARRRARELRKNSGLAAE